MKPMIEIKTFGKWSTADIKVKDPERKGKSLVHILIKWISDRDFLSLIEGAGEPFSPSFNRPSMFIDEVTISVLSDVADKLKGLSYDPEVLSAEDARIINPKEAADRFLRKK